MRVYLPSTLPRVVRALTSGEVGPAPIDGYAVTPALREWYANGGTEELEYAAMMAAARASLRLLVAELESDPSAQPRRVVLAAEVPDDTVAKEPGDRSLAGNDRALVRLAAPVPLSKVVSAHIDGPEAVDDVRTAVAALAAADAGDEDARFTVDGAEGHELMWYATQELPFLFRQ
jgi:hypothetical protein